jgi:uncharacterized membrane protein
MRYVGNIILKGLAAVLPVGLTIYIVYLIAVSIEQVLRPIIKAAIPSEYYVPGMGLAAGLVLLFFVGLAVNALLVRKLLQLGEYVLERIPLVKSLYGALRDFMDYFSAGQSRGKPKQVVMVRFGNIHVMGFLTHDDLQHVEGLSLTDQYVAVYLPMSYQIGGYTLYLPRSRITPVDMNVEDAMRWVLTAGLSRARTR